MKNINYLHFFLVLCLGISFTAQAATNKVIATKAAKIALYTVGIIVPVYALKGFDSCLKYDEKGNSTEENSIRDTLLGCIAYTVIGHQAHKRHEARTILTGTAAIIGCLGYSAHGLYNELNDPLITEPVKKAYHKIKGFFSTPIELPS